MKRIATLLVALLLVVGTVAALPASGALAGLQGNAAAQATTTPEASGNDSAAVEPGARLSGAVGVHQSELRGDVESRRFGIRVAKADSADAKAGIVAEQADENRRQVDSLQQRLHELKQARENGSIGPGEYAVRAAEIHTELNNVQHMSNQSAAVARDLPADTLEANGVNVTAIERLRERAANMSGPEVAAIAQTIAGSEHRPGTAGARATDRSGGADDARNRSDGAQNQANGVLNSTAGNSNQNDGPTGSAIDTNVTVDSTNTTETSTTDSSVDG